MRVRSGGPKGSSTKRQEDSLTPTQLKFLRIVMENERITKYDFIKNHDIPESTANKLLNELEDWGYLQSKMEDGKRYFRISVRSKNLELDRYFFPEPNCSYKLGVDAVSSSGPIIQKVEFSVKGGGVGEFDDKGTKGQVASGRYMKVTVPGAIIKVIEGEPVLFALSPHLTLNKIPPWEQTNI